MKISKKFEQELIRKGLIPAPDTCNSVVVSVPPGTNSLFFNLGRGGRAKTKKYSDWIKKNKKEVERLTPVKEYPVEVLLRCQVKIRSNRDLANLEKATIDLLVSCGILEDDSVNYVSDVVMRYRPNDNGQGLKIEIRKPTED